jgi:hypothetical protein
LAAATTATYRVQSVTDFRSDFSRERSDICHKDRTQS